MKKLFTLIAVTCALNANAQVSNLTGTSNSVVMEQKYKTTEGSPYLYNDWKPGTVTDIDGKKIDAALLKYDSYQDKISIFKDGTQIILNEYMYPDFTLTFYDDKDKITRRFTHSKALGVPGLKGYYEVIHNGEYKLIRKIKTSYIKDVVSDYGTNRDVEKFITNDRVILVDPEGVVNEVKGSKNAVYASLGDAEIKAREIAKRKKLNIKKEDDFSEILTELEQ